MGSVKGLLGYIILTFLSLVFLSGFIPFGAKKNGDLSLFDRVDSPAFSRKDKKEEDFSPGRDNRGSEIDNIDFFGNINPYGREVDGEVVIALLNSPGWGYVNITFKNSVDLWNNAVSFFARGREGNETLRVAITDRNKRTSHLNGSYSVKLSGEWHRIIVNAEQIKAQCLDKSKIISIKLIPGGTPSGDNEEQVIYIKNIFFMGSHAVKE